MQEIFNNQMIYKIIPIVLTAIGTVFTIYRALKKQEQIRPVFVKRSTLLLRHAGVNNLKIEYKGQETKNFTITNVVIWNAGKKTIYDADVASADTIKIIAKDGIKIFDATIVKVSIPENKFERTFNADENIIDVSFEYMDFNHGVAIQVSHDGINSNDIEVTGTFKSYGKIIPFENNAQKTVNDIMENPAKNFIPTVDDRKSLFRIIIIVSLIFLALGFFCSPFWIATVIIIQGLIYVAVAFGLLFSIKTPKEFEFIDE